MSIDTPFTFCFTCHAVTVSQRAATHRIDVESNAALSGTSKTESFTMLTETSMFFRSNGSNVRMT